MEASHSVAVALVVFDVIGVEHGPVLGSVELPVVLGDGVGHVAVDGLSGWLWSSPVS